MKTACPNCSQSIEGDDSLEGATVDCPTCNQDFVFPSAASESVAVAQDVSVAMLPLAYGLTLGSYVVLIGGFTLTSGFGRDPLDGLRFWIPLILQVVTLAAGYGVWSKAKGYSISLGVSLILLGPFGAVALLLFTDRSKFPKQEKPSVLACSVCGTANSPGTVFCKNCSHNLHMKHAAPTAQQDIGTQPPPLPGTPLNAERPPAVVIACVLLGLSLLAVAPAISQIGNDLQEKLGIFAIPSIVIGITVTTLCTFGLWKMRRWAVITFACYTALNQIGWIMLGAWGAVTLICPLIILALMAMHFEMMR